MPRKRTTRVQTTKTTGKIDVAVAEDLSEKEKREQLNIFLREFDCKVKNVLKDIEKKKRALLIFIQMRFEQQIGDLPCEIKDMTLEDFARCCSQHQNFSAAVDVLECGGTFQTALAHVRASAQDTKQNKIAEIQNLKWNSKEVLEDITEEGNEESAPMFAQPTTVRAKRKHDKTAPRTAASTRNRFNTPANKISQRTWGPTPLVTPKFDPSLPMTPENSREAKPGEKFMSLAGSPILVKKNRRISQAFDKEEVTQEWSDIAGVDLTPTRVEQMIRALSAKINQK